MIICIDPGHGGEDNGAAYGYAEEDDFNLIIGYLLRFVLQERGFVVIMTRERDVYVPLSQRCSIANANSADLFVSIHCDAWHDETVEGISTHVYSDETLEVGGRIQKSLTTIFPGHKDRGVKKSDFYVLRETSMPAVLVECEFVSNPETRKFLREPENQLKIAYAISGGI